MRCPCVKPSEGRFPSSRSGQTMVILLAVLVILAFVVLWNADLHKIITVKNICQNGGDAAALAAARWQGITLNLVGDLNIMQAAALSGGDADAANAVAALQARLCYVGPLIGLMAAQQVAKNNGIYNNEAFSQRILDHANEVLTDYPAVVGPGGQLLFPEPYPNCWQEYADMLFMLAGDGIAAAPDNAQLYTDYNEAHILLNPGFYDAVGGQVWCWFYHNAPDLLPDYTTFTWWPPLPPMIAQFEPMNCEYFGLGLTKIPMVDNLATIDLMNTLRQSRNLSTTPLTPDLLGVTASWYAFGAGRWTEWSAFSSTNSPPFPMAGPIKPQYDYAGADAAVRVEATADRHTPNAAGSHIIWTAAAKPFGDLNSTGRPDSCYILLPAFHDVRLIPVDASSAPAAGAFDIAWRIHIENHLPGYTDSSGNFLAGYMDMGVNAPALSPSCWYCQQLLQWEVPQFRENGITWLNANSNACLVSGSGPGSPGGGSRRGH